MEYGHERNTFTPRFRLQFRTPTGWDVRSDKGNFGLARRVEGEEGGWKARVGEKVRGVAEGRGKWGVG